MIRKEIHKTKHLRYFPFGDVVHLIFPEVCLICASELSRREKNICSVCNSEIHTTNYQFFSESTPMDQLFWGRISIQNTYAHLFFHENKGARKILFSLKYQNNPEIGFHFGAQMAIAIAQISGFQSAEVFIPVPLHPKKQFIRGYNQSEQIAKGIAEALGKPCKTQLIRRAKHSTSQTKKSRFQRWENVDGSFQVSSSIRNYKHVVLVDDVITTGATIESIAQSLRKMHPELQISVVTLAIA